MFNVLQRFLPFDYVLVLIAQRVCLIIAETVVIVATVYYTWGILKASREANISATFSSTLLRAGKPSRIHPISYTRLSVDLFTKASSTSCESYDVQCILSLNSVRAILVLNITDFVLQMTTVVTACSPC